MATEPSAALARALAFLRRVTERGAAEVVELPPLGHVFSTPELPRVHALNTLWLEDGPHPGVTVTDLSALADAHLPHAPQPHVWIDDEATGRRLEPGLIAADWKVEHDLVMGLAGETPPADTSRVREAGDEDVADLYRAWFGEEDEEEMTSDPEVAEQLLQYVPRERVAGGGRLLVVDGADGRPAAMTQVRVGDGLAQVEDVFTRADERGRGHARALLTRAIELARAEGPELTFILADDRDTPKELYARLGFAPLGVAYSAYRRRPPA